MSTLDVNAIAQELVDSYEAGDFDKDEYLGLTPEPRSDDAEAFILRLGRERTAAIDRRHAAIDPGLGRLHLSATAFPLHRRRAAHAVARNRRPDR